MALRSKIEEIFAELKANILLIQWEKHANNDPVVFKFLIQPHTNIKIVDWNQCGFAKWKDITREIL
jgi:hypothetical protein